MGKFDIWRVSNYAVHQRCCQPRFHFSFAANKAFDLCGFFLHHLILQPGINILLLIFATKQNSSLLPKLLYKIGFYIVPV